jgi:gliding motility-associated-like protein
VLFQLCFNVVGDCDETTSIDFLGEPVEIVASNTEGVVPVESTSGMFTVNCTPTIILTPFDQSCSDVCDGYLVLEYSGLQSPVDINWSSADTMNLCAGQYSVTLTDANSVELSASANIGAPSAIVITGATSGDFATGNGVIDITVNGGTPDYTYAWNTTPVQTTEDATGLTFGSYTVVVTDANGCEESYSDTIVLVIDDLEIDIDVTPKGQFDISCFDECDGEATITVDNAVLPLTILWDDGNTDMVRDDLCAGEYCLTVTDDNGNSIDTCFTLVGPSALILEIEKDCSTGAADGSATAVVSGGAGNYTYLWNDSEQSTTAIIENLLPNTYIVVVTDGNGCQISDDVNLDCTPTDNCYDWREIITPNGDGLNENFIITCADETDNELSIYNRWGQLVYETVNYNNDWHGEDLDGNPVPDDTYMFVLQVKTTTETEIYKGAVSVFRKFN